MSKQLDLTPVVLDLVVYSGDGEDFQIYFVDSSDAKIDMSEYTWASQIRELRTSPVGLDLDVDSSDAVDGLLTIHISPTITSSLPKTCFWDLQGTYSGRPQTVIQGSVTCKKDVTR